MSVNDAYFHEVGKLEGIDSCYDLEDIIAGLEDIDDE